MVRSRASRLALALFAGAVCTAQAQADGDVVLATVPVDRLKAAYLECARLSSRELLSLQMASACVKVGDELKHREFGGDFDRLIAWWHRVRDAEPASDAVSAVTGGVVPLP